MALGPTCSTGVTLILPLSFNSRVLSEGMEESALKGIQRASEGLTPQTFPGPKQQCKAWNFRKWFQGRAPSSSASPAIPGQSWSLLCSWQGDNCQANHSIPGTCSGKQPLTCHNWSHDLVMRPASCPDWNSTINQSAFYFLLCSPFSYFFHILFCFIFFFILFVLVLFLCLFFSVNPEVPRN